jgi:hypothetical protein
MQALAEKRETLWSMITRISAEARSWAGIEWSWEDYTKNALTVIGKDGRDDLEDRLQQNFPHRVERNNMDTAPRALRTVLMRTGGLRAGQRAYYSQDVDGAVAYVLWWPWQDKQHTSIRLGFTVNFDSVEEEGNIGELLGF